MAKFDSIVVTTVKESARFLGIRPETITYDTKLPAPKSLRLLCARIGKRSVGRPFEVPPDVGTVGDLTTALLMNRPRLTLVK